MAAKKTFFVVAAAIAYALSLIFAYLNTAKVKGLYYSDNGAVDSKYYQEASPIGTAFAIVWPIIYVWNLAGVIYMIVSLWLPEIKSPLKTNPPILNNVFFAGYIMAFSTTVGWLFAFDREILGLALALLILAVASVYIAIGSCCKALAHNVASLTRLPDQKKSVEWTVRIVIQNGLSTFATWLTVATLLNLADVILYQDSFGVTPAVQRGLISIQNGSTVALILLLAIIIAWFILDNFIWDKFTRFIFTPYAVLILALSGIIAKLRPVTQSNPQNLIIASVELGIVLIALLAKISLVTYRCVTRGTAV
ncbi:uncharacterized protein LOC100186076 [Ciona intestinalis]